jgi:hypothetical protein
MIGRVVVTIEASMGEVIERPKIYIPWLKVSANIDAKKIFSISFGGICSFGRKAERIQKAMAAPVMRKVVTLTAVNS